MTQVDHTDIGAYVLGVLNERDTEAFELHLMGCSHCQAELKELASLPELFNQLDVADVVPEQPAPAKLRVVETGNIEAHQPTRPTAEQPVAPPELLPKLMDEVAAARRRRRRVGFLAAAAAAVLIVAGPVVTFGLKGLNSVPPPQALPDRTVSATDQGSGVTATVGMKFRNWGTGVDMELGGVKGPLKCELVAVSGTGATQSLLSWSVPEKGYGVPGSPDKLKLPGSTFMKRDEIKRLEVQTLEGETLVSIPV